MDSKTVTNFRLRVKKNPINLIMLRPGQKKVCLEKIEGVSNQVAGWELGLLLVGLSAHKIRRGVPQASFSQDHLSLLSMVFDKITEMVPIHLRGEAMPFQGLLWLHSNISFRFLIAVNLIIRHKNKTTRRPRLTNSSLNS